MPAMKGLRAEAVRKYGETVRKVVAGWSFVLSIDHLRDQMRTNQKADPETFAKTLASFGMDASLWDACKESDSCEDHFHFHFSARVYPLDRSSAPADWENLGLATAVMNVSEAAHDLALETIRDEVAIRTRAIHYAWTEPREPAN